MAKFSPLISGFALLLTSFTSCNAEQTNAIA